MYADAKNIEFRRVTREFALVDLSASGSMKTIRGHFDIPKDQVIRFDRHLREFDKHVPEANAPWIRWYREGTTVVLEGRFFWDDDAVGNWERAMAFLYRGYCEILIDDQALLLDRLTKTVRHAELTVQDGAIVASFSDAIDGRLEGYMLNALRELPHRVAMNDVYTSRNVDAFGNVLAQVRASKHVLGCFATVAHAYEEAYLAILRNALDEAQADVAELNGMLKGRTV